MNFGAVADSNFLVLECVPSSNVIIGGLGWGGEG